MMTKTLKNDLKTHAYLLHAYVGADTRFPVTITKRDIIGLLRDLDDTAECGLRYVPASESSDGRAYITVDESAPVQRGERHPAADVRFPAADGDADPATVEPEPEPETVTVKKSPANKSRAKKSPAKKSA